MTRRFVDPVARRTVARMKQYTFACDVHRANRAVIPLQLQARFRRSKVARSAVGSGSSTGTALLSKGWLGAFIVLQARARGAKARARFPVLVASWRRSEELILDLGLFGEKHPRATASFLRESTVEAYSGTYSSAHGRDGVRGARSTRCAGGKSKAAK